MGISEHVLVDPQSGFSECVIYNGADMRKNGASCVGPAASQRERRRRAGKAKDATVNEGGERQIPYWHHRTP